MINNRVAISYDVLSSIQLTFVRWYRSMCAF